MPQPHEHIPSQPCSGRNQAGEPCKRKAPLGGTVCRYHGGAARQVVAKAAVRAEVLQWGLGQAHADPGEVLLRLVTQSARRVETYAAELEQLVSEEPRLRDALVGESWTATERGDIYKVGEYIRGLAQLEAQERDRGAGFAAKAVAAGLDKRRVELAERQGALMAQFIAAVLNDPELGLTAAQRRAVPDVARRHLALVAPVVAG
jgi:hypothetical protein